MRILQVNKFFYRKGGSEAYFFDLSYLLEKNGHKVIHFSIKNEANEVSPYKDFFLNNINFQKREGFLKDIKKFGHSLYSFEAKEKLEKLILETKPKIAHLHNISHHISPSIFSIFKKHNIPVVQTLHDYQLICPNFKLLTQGKVCERCKKRKYWNAVRYKCVHNSTIESLAGSFEMYFHKLFCFYEKGVSGFIAPSKFLKKKIEEWGVLPRAKNFNVPNFINLDKFDPNYKPGNYALYFGRLSHEKGLNDLLEAMQGTKMKLKIVGSGPMKNNIKYKLSKNRDNNIEILGYKKGDELHDIIRKAKFVVLPPIWYENYPISLIEAAALGKPMIGTKIGGVPEIIEDGINGYLAHSNDSEDLRKKMLLLWTNSNICEKMGKRARKIVEKNNSPESHYEKIMEVYSKVMESK